MTALVAVLNPQGVALAADSAATLEGPNTSKVYNTANKLFALSKHHPVGIMIYSSIDVMGLPAETAIKVYRERLGASQHPTIEAYAADFRSFLECNKELFPEDARQRACDRVAYEYARCISDFFQTEVGRLLDSAHTPQDCIERRKEILSNARKTLEEKTKPIAKVPKIAKGYIEKLLLEFVGPQLREDLWDVNWPLSEEEDKDITWILDACMFRDFKESVEPEDKTIELDRTHTLESSETGFVLAGFGETEFLPAIDGFEIAFSYEGFTRYKNPYGMPEKIAGTNRAIVVPFAQSDMVYSFMEGKNRDFNQVLFDGLKDFFLMHARNVTKIPGMTEAQQSAYLKNLWHLRESCADHFNGILRSWREGQIQPTLDAIEHLPKSELATIAEALVNLTIHKRRTSNALETVGPPVDVAVISKGDGLIWINRKHYFKPELNPHFFANYYQRSIPK